ncbi:MAG: hypothetical protein Q8R15_00955 [Candidatus Micrarchaeota archaeon]|nr:hypothetical protein [Candidatus Micrarchaeota archaeon]
MEIGVYEKSIDLQGRIVVPVSLREQFKEFIMFVYKDYVKLVPKKKHKMSDFFDSVKTDVTLTGDYHKLKKDLLAEKYKW